MSSKKDKRAQRRAQEQLKGLSASAQAAFSSALDRVEWIILAGYGLFTNAQWIELFKSPTLITLATLQPGFFISTAALMISWIIAIYIKSRLV